MRKILFAAGILVALVAGHPSPSSAAAPPSSIQICIATTAVTGCVTKTINDADAAIFVSWCQSAYPGSNDVSGNPTVLAAGPCLAAWAGGIFQGTIDNVTRWSRANAANTAATAVSPIKIQ